MFPNKCAEGIIRGCTHERGFLPGESELSFVFSRVLSLATTPWFRRSNKLQLLGRWRAWSDRLGFGRGRIEAGPFRFR